MKYSRIRTFIALALVFIMSFTTIGAAFADDVTEEVIMENGEIVQPASLVEVTVIDGNVTVEKDEYGSTAVTVISENEEHYDSKENVWVDKEGTAEDSSLTVKGDISDKANYDATGAEIHAEDGKTASLTVGGGISAENTEESGGIAIEIFSQGEDSLAKVETGEGIEGSIQAIAADDGTTTFKVEEGGVTSENINTVSLNNQGGHISGEITGNVTSDTTAVDISNSENYVYDLNDDDFKALGDVSWVINGNNYSYYDEATNTSYSFTVNEDGRATWGSKIVREAGDSALVINGNVTTTSDDSNKWSVTAASINTNYDGSMATLTVNGDVSATNETGSANGIMVSGNGDTTIGVQVTGGITVKGDEDYTSQAISISNSGSQVKMDVGGDVSSTDDGVRITSNRSYKTTDLKEADIAEIKEKATPSYEGSKYYNYTDETGIVYNYYVDDDGEFVSGTLYTPSEKESNTELNIKGDISADSGTGVNVQNNDGTATVNVGGKITSGGTGIYANDNYFTTQNNNLISNTNITVKGDVESEGTGISATGTTGSTIIGVDGKVISGGTGISATNTNSTMAITVRGDIMATTAENSINGIYASTTGEDGEMNITVDGSITATGPEKYETDAIEAKNTGSKMTITVGKDVTSSGRGVLVTNQQNYDRKTLKESDIASIKDKATVYSSWDEGKEYRYTDTDGNKYFFTVDADGNFVSAYMDVPSNTDSDTQINIAGSVDAAYGNGVEVRNSDGTATVNVGGKITSGGTGIYSSDNYYGTQNDSLISNTTITVKGDVESEGAGIAANGATGTTFIDVDGSVTSGGTGIAAVNTDSKMSIAVGKDLTATSEDSGIKGIYASTTGEDGELHIAVDGNITVTGSDEYSYDTEAIEADNYGSKLTITVGGNATSTGDGIEADNHKTYTKSMTQKDFEEIKGKAEQDTSYVSEDGTKRYTYTDDDDVEYAYYTDEDGAFRWGDKYGTYEKENDTTIAVAKDVNAGGNGIDAENEYGKMAISVGGNVTAARTGVDVDNSDGTTNIDIKGNLTASATEKNKATGIDADAYGKDGELTIKIGGDVEAYGNEDAESDYGHSKAVDAENSGSKMSIDVAGDVKSSYDGVHLKNYKTHNKSMSQEEIEAIKDKAEYKYEESDGSKRYEYKDEDGNQYSFYVMPDGTYKNGNATLVYEKEDETVATVGGSIEATGTGLTTANAYGDMTVTVGKDITVSSEDEDDTVMGVHSMASGGETSIDIGGNVSASTEGYNAAGVALSSSDEDAVTNFKLKGSVTALANGKEQKNTEDESYPDRDVDGIFIDNDAGTINATIGGDVISNVNGVSVDHDRIYDRVTLTNEDVAKILDKATKQEEGTEEDEDGAIHERAYYTYEDEDGYSYEFTMVDGQLKWGSKIKRLMVDATTNLEIDGQISVNSDGEAIGLYTEIDNGEINVDVKGGIFVEGSASEGDEWNDRVYVDGIRAVAVGDDSKLTISVVGGITTASNTLTDKDNGSAISVSNQVDETSLADVNISVEGDVDATGTGIYVNSGNIERKWLEGTAEIKTEDYLMTSKSLNGDGEVVEEKIYYNKAGGFYYNEDGEMWEEIDPETGFTKIKVIGEVHGDNIGINVGNGDHTDIIVDGTLSGGESAILINNEIIDEDMKLTVWEVQPDEEGNIVERIIGYDDDGNPIYAQDREIEKQLQYIIRIEPTQASMINLEGATDYEGYKVAHEGDTVTLKLNIPKGYAVDGAFGDLGQQYQLLKDASGNYYLVVPRGGAVMLSLKMHRVASQTVKIKYDPNGGIVDGHDSLYTVSTYKNKELTLPTPDEREGYEFVGWYKAEFGRDSERWTEPSEDDANILKAGTTFKADQNYTCTAIWKTK